MLRLAVTPSALSCLGRSRSGYAKISSNSQCGEFWEILNAARMFWDYLHGFCHLLFE